MAGGWRAGFVGFCQVIQKAKAVGSTLQHFSGPRRPSRRRVGRRVMHYKLQRNAMANVEDIPFIVEDRRMLSRVAGDRSEFWGFGGLPC